jgi:GH24 family phage-related lysozyme (muramidase)
VNAAGLLLLKQRENAPLLAHPEDPKNLRAFWDPIGRVWTIGYGHTGEYPQEFAGGTGLMVGSGDCLASEQRACDLLVADLAPREQLLLPKLPQGLNENQQAALTLLAYNVGVGAVLNSHLLRVIAGYIGFPGATLDDIPSTLDVVVKPLYLAWDHGEVAGKEQAIAGLKARREAEWQLFTAPVEAKA